jgi:dipeptidase D
MNETIRTLEPTAIWNNFANLNAVPRPSKKEERVIAFMKSFGEDLGLETMVDPIGNVIIRKPATPGMEDRKTMVLQGHLDMVHQKNSDTDFDFETQGIQMYVEGDWVRARGTTLGADNGLGVAAIMAVLESKDIPHPALEALFTIDEETGMTGAQELRPGTLKGEVLLNLDTEEDDEIGVGCAGGVDITAEGEYQQVEVTPGSKAFALRVFGLQGGHSGMDIDKGLGNANKINNRLLYAVRESLSVCSIDGGGLRNAIPRESKAIVVVAPGQLEEVEKALQDCQKLIRDEYQLIEPDLKFGWEPVPLPGHCMAMADQQKLINVIHAAHNGVYRMSPAIHDLVEASNNIARVAVGDGQITVSCLTRSSVESSKMDVADSLRAVFELAGYRVSYSGSYPGWAPNMESPILKVMAPLYQALFGQKPNVAACHAGLECGILGQHYPDMDMISFGPTIKGAHSPDERASISSTMKFWKYLKEILKNAPVKA